MTHRVTLIHNPAAARWSASRLRTIIGTLESLGCAVDARETAGPGDAVKLAESAAKDEADVVAVFGGDGTIIQAVQGLVGSGVPIGLIPGGTGNLLALNLNIPRNVARAAKIVATGQIRSIDLGQLDSAVGRSYFAVASGAGFDAEIMVATLGKSKRRWGQMAYVMQTIRSLGNIRLARYQMTIDDKQHEVEAATVLIANCRTILPPFLHLGKDIELDDGQFDIVVINARNAFQVFVAGFHLLVNVTDGHRVQRFRGGNIRIETDRSVPIQLDGEPIAHTPFEVSMLAGALPIVVAG